MIDRLETLARQLETSPDFRVLRRLRRRETFAEVQGNTRIGVVLDCETTGLNPAQDEIIELAMLKFAFTSDGQVLRIIDAFDQLQQPSAPIPQAIKALTGITDEMVEGQSIATIDVEAFVADATIVIAHNAKFDRAFTERTWTVFRDIDWACSYDQIPWREHGYEGTKLAHLLAHQGCFFEAHRAEDDCRALLHLLASPLGPEEPSALSVLLGKAGETAIRLHAAGAPFAAKDLLKSRGYRWSDGSEGAPKAWWKDFSPADYELELEFLQANVYDGRRIRLPTAKITARERHSARLLR